MRRIFQTESGSLYTIDKAAMTWFRNSPNTRVRGNTGKLQAWPKVKIGESCVMLCPPLDPGATIRVITTTPVISTRLI